jgi:hypothetical protein
MVVDQTENFVRESLSSSVNDTESTFSVTDASTFPDPSNGEYNIVCWDDSKGRPDEDPDVEVVRVTGRDINNDELTVTRGQENTSATSHPDDSALHLSATSKVFEDIQTHDHTTTDESTVPNSGLTNDTITVNANNGLSGGSAALGNSLSVGISGVLSLDDDLEAVDGETIWDETNTYIPQGRLQNDSVTITSGDGLKNGGGVSLGNSLTLDIEPADFAGTFLSDDGTDNLTVDIGNGIENDGSDNLRVNPADIAGSLLSEDGSNQLQVDESSISHDSIDQATVSPDDHHTDPTAGTGITDEGTNQFGIASGGVGTTELATPFADLSTLVGTPVTLGGDLEATDGETIWDESNTYIPQGRLQNDSVTVTSGDGLKNGGSVSLGSSITLDIEPADFAGDGLADDGSDNLTVSQDSTGTITATGGSSPAVDTVVSTSLSQTDPYDVLLYVDSDPTFDADYQFNWDYAHFWDDSESTLKIDFTVNWDTDPGNTNDVTLRWEVIDR